MTTTENRIELNLIAKLGDLGTIWHTTGSGKTLTAFKASTLLKENESIHGCMIFDRTSLSNHMAPLDLSWKSRTQAERVLVDDLAPLLHKLAQGREIAGLPADEKK